MPDRKYELTQEDRDTIFLNQILPELTKNTCTSKEPRAHILGGQPGAGKSHFIRILKSTDSKLLVINGDDLRGYHPHYTHLLEIVEIDAADITQQDTNYWIERAIEEAIRNKISFVVEGTMKTSAVPLSTAKSLHNNGYSVEVDAILINPAISMVDLYKRYLEQKKVLGHARFTKLSAHDDTVKNILENISTINDSPHINTLKVFKRISDRYDSLFERSDGDLKSDELLSVLNTQKDSKLNKEERSYLLESRVMVIELAKELNINLPAELQKNRGENTRTRIDEGNITMR